MNTTLNVYYDNAWVNDISKIYYQFLSLMRQLLFISFNLLQIKYQSEILPCL